jgi:hypothetical protein
MPMFLILMLFGIYFFIAGFTFRTMIEEVKTGTWPVCGAILLSVCWIGLISWACLNLVCKTTERWYIKFASTIFEA